MSKTTRTSKRPPAKSKVIEPANKRKVVVFGSLVAVLTLTSALLLALEPSQLRPDRPGLFAVDTADTFGPIFDTHVPATLGRWRYIYIHHSASPDGSALTLAQRPGGLGDHFVIGNGEGSLDGEIQISERWTDQQAPAAPPGAKAIDPNCISICLIGDFHQNLPTPVQMQRLEMLVSSLQAKFKINADKIMMITDQPANHAVEIGRYFPVAAFRNQLLK